MKRSEMRKKRENLSDEKVRVEHRKWHENKNLQLTHKNEHMVNRMHTRNSHAGH